MKHILLWCFGTLLGSTFAHARQATATETPVAKTVQPKIMVIPRVGEGQNMKKLYDTSVNIQVGLAKVNEAFLKKGANLVSFDQSLKQASANQAMQRASGNQEDFKSQVLQMSGADIYVEVKLDVVKHTNRNANSVTVIMEGYQTGTSNLLGSKTGRSRINMTEDIGLLTSQALDSITGSFLDLMQFKFDDIHENGQSMYVEFSLAANSKYDFDSEIGPQKKLLSECIDDWFAAHAYKAVFNNQGVVANKMILSDVRIPLKDPTNPKVNYNGQKLFTDIRKFFQSMNIPIKREIGTNNKVLVTII